MAKWQKQKYTQWVLAKKIDKQQIESTVLVEVESFSASANPFVKNNCQLAHFHPVPSQLLH